MTPERWRQVKEVVEAVWERDGLDHSLRQLVLELKYVTQRQL